METSIIVLSGRGECVHSHSGDPVIFSELPWSANTVLLSVVSSTAEPSRHGWSSLGSSSHSRILHLPSHPVGVGRKSSVESPHRASKALPVSSGKTEARVMTSTDWLVAWQGGHWHFCWASACFRLRSVAGPFFFLSSWCSGCRRPEDHPVS